MTINQVVKYSPCLLTLSYIKSSFANLNVMQKIERELIIEFFKTVFCIFKKRKTGIKTAKLYHQKPIYSQSIRFSTWILIIVFEMTKPRSLSKISVGSCISKNDQHFSVCGHINDRKNKDFCKVFFLFTNIGRP